MRKLKENFDFIVIGGILLVSVVVFVWVKIYPTIVDPLIENPDQFKVNYIVEYQDEYIVATWGRGTPAIDNELNREMLDILEDKSATRVFRSENTGKGLNGNTYYISFSDGDTMKEIIMGENDTTYGDISDGKRIGNINESERLIAEIREVLASSIGEE